MLILGVQSLFPCLPHTLNIAWRKGGRSMVSILSIDGGGIRGIIPAAFLAEIERLTGKPVSGLFDLVAGTSTGGLLACALTVPDARGKPKHTARQIHAAYLEHGGAIFHRGMLRKAATLGGLTGPKYSPRALERWLAEYLGSARLHETLADILVTAYDMASSTPWFFKTTFAKTHRGPEDDPLLAQAAYATAAAPTYFPPLALESLCLIDGGVFASNPAMCAYAEARKLHPYEKDFLLVSLGTGVHVQNRPCAKIERWGVANWAVPITDVMLNSSSATVDYQLRQILGDESYARFQTRLPAEAAAMDDASRENLVRLELIAKKAVEDNSAQLERVCRMLSGKMKLFPARERVFVSRA